MNTMADSSSQGKVSCAMLGLTIHGDQTYLVAGGQTWTAFASRSFLIWRTSVRLNRWLSKSAE